MAKIETLAWLDGDILPVQEIRVSPLAHSLHYGTGVFDVVNRRAINDPEIEENRREAIEWYVFVRDACLQDREGDVQDGAKPTAEEEEDLYEIEE